MKRQTRSGNAIMEVAVFGGICIAAIGFLLRIGLEMNYDQEARMAAFRRCLNVAKGDDETFDDAVSVSTHVTSDRWMADPGDGLNMSTSAVQAGAHCVKGNRLTWGFMTASLTGPGPGEPKLVGYVDSNAVFAHQHDYPYNRQGFVKEMTSHGSNTHWVASGAMTNAGVSGGGGSNVSYNMRGKSGGGSVGGGGSVSW